MVWVACPGGDALFSSLLVEAKPASPVYGVVIGTSAGDRLLPKHCAYAVGAVHVRRLSFLLLPLPCCCTPCNLCGCPVLAHQDGVVLGDNVTASHSLLCEGVVVGAGATVQPGVVLSYGVVVGPRHTVPAYSVISLCKQLNTEVRSTGHVDERKQLLHFVASTG